MKGLFHSRIFGMAALVIAALAVSALMFAQQKKTDESVSCPMMKDMSTMSNMSRDDCPMMKNGGQPAGMNHDEMVMKNGEREMGFSQTATTHHFIITKEGGAIRITTKDPKDSDNRDKIRDHLKMIADQFKKGDLYDAFCCSRTDAARRT